MEDVWWHRCCFDKVIIALNFKNGEKSFFFFFRVHYFLGLNLIVANDGLHEIGNNVKGIFYGRAALGFFFFFLRKCPF